MNNRNHKGYWMGLCCLLVLALSACSEVKEPVEPEKDIIEDVVDTTDRMTQDYEVIELSVPDELKESGKKGISILSMQDNEVYIITYEVNGVGGGQPSTEKLYVYHPDTEELELLYSTPLGEYMNIQDARIINGDLYEIRQYTSSQTDILYNGEVIQTNTVSGIAWYDHFMNVNGKLQYIMTTEEDGRYFLYLYELDKGKINELYKEEFDLLSFQTDLSGIEIKYNFYQNNKELLVFSVVNKNTNEYNLHVYDGSEVKKIPLHLPLNQHITSMVPLKDGVLINTEIDWSNQDSKGTYWVDSATGKMTWVSTGHIDFGNFKHILDDVFEYSAYGPMGYSENDDIYLGRIEDGELKTRVLSKLPEGRKIYGSISDNQDFIFIEDLVKVDNERFRELHFYVVNWLE